MKTKSDMTKNHEPPHFIYNPAAERDRLREINAELLAALESTLTPLIRLGDYIGNEDIARKGLHAFDRCAIIGQVRAAIKKAESWKP